MKKLIILTLLLSVVCGFAKESNQQSQAPRAKRALVDSVRKSFVPMGESHGHKIFRKRGELVVFYKDASFAKASTRFTNRKHLRSQMAQDGIGLVNFDDTDNNLQTAISEAASLPGAVKVEPNIIFEKASRPNGGADRSMSAQSRLVHSKKSGKRKASSNKQTVLILDTGLDTTRISSNPQIKTGFNAIYRKVAIAIPGEEEADPSVQDYNGHGTMVSSVLFDSYDALAPSLDELNLVPVKVLDQTGYGTLENVVRGLRWALKQNPDVINMSFSSPKESPMLAEMISTAEKKGVTIVASAGNDATAELPYPAGYESVITVGSANTNGTIAYFSNRGKGVDLYAMGTEWNSWNLTSQGGGTVAFNGTSASAAYISGTLAALSTIKGSMKLAKDELNKNLVERSFARYPSQGRYLTLSEATLKSRLVEPSSNLEAISLDFKRSDDGTNLEMELNMVNSGSLSSMADTLRVDLESEMGTSTCKLAPIAELKPTEQIQQKYSIPLENCAPLGFLEQTGLHTLSLEVLLGEESLGKVDYVFSQAPFQRPYIYDLTLTPWRASEIRTDRKVMATIRNDGNAPIASIKIRPVIWNGVGESVGLLDSSTVGPEFLVENLGIDEVRSVEILVPLADSLSSSFTIDLISSGEQFRTSHAARGFVSDPAGRFQVNYSQNAHRNLARRAVQLLDALSLTPPDLRSASPDYFGTDDSYVESDWFESLTSNYCSQTSSYWDDDFVTNWLSGIKPTLVHGANDADEWDPAYCYSFKDRWDSHFWFVDYSDDDGLNSLGSNHHSALTKIRAMYYGGYGSHINKGARDNYNAGYRKGAWYQMGHIVHLLSDMSLGAHTNDDNWHGTYGDVYEQWMEKGYYSNASQVSINSQGMVDPYHAENGNDPVRFLTYTTAQVGNSFPRYSTLDGTNNYANGNRTAGGNPPNYPNYMAGVFSMLPSRPLGARDIGKDEVWDHCPDFCCWCSNECQFVDLVGTSESRGDCNSDGHTDYDNTDGGGSNGDGDVARIRDAAYPYAVRAAAGMIYLFARETGQYQQSSGPAVSLLLQ